MMLEMDQSQSMEYTLLPYLVDEQQMQEYREGREYLYNGRGAKRYERKVRKNMTLFPSEVTLDVKGGPNRGSNKESRAGQAIAGMLFDRRFHNHHLSLTGKEPVAHYLSLGWALKVLGERKFVDPSHHPFYRPQELQIAWDFIYASTALARVKLPQLYPQYTHRLELELPFTLMGTAMNVDPNSFMDFALANTQGQEEAATQSDACKSHTIDLVLNKKFQEFGVKTDYPDIKPEDIAWNMGSRESMIASNEKVNELMLQAMFEGKLIPKIQFTREELTDLEFRNNQALPAYVRYQMSEVWRIPRGQRLIRENPYISGKKHYFVRLVRTYTFGANHHLCPIDLNPLLDLLRDCR